MKRKPTGAIGSCELDKRASPSVSAMAVELDHGEAGDHMMDHVITVMDVVKFGGAVLAIFVVLSVLYHVLKAIGDGWSH